MAGRSSRLEDKKLMLRCRDIVIKKGLSVRQTEQLCKTFKDPKPGAKAGGAHQRRSRSSVHHGEFAHVLCTQK